jgi:hypothetical protein
MSLKNKETTVPVEDLGYYTIKFCIENLMMGGDILKTTLGF